MKKIISLVFAIVISLCAFAEHPVIMGIDLGTTSASDFRAALVDKGWTFMNGDPNILCNGTFAGHNNCVLLIGLTNTDKVFKVVIFLEKEDSWSVLRSNYNSMVESYTAKYGTPTGSFRNFRSPYEEGDGYEMTGVKSDKCNFASYWIKTGYSVAIEISKMCKVRISYEDDEHMAEKKAEKEKVVQNDI